MTDPIRLQGFKPLTGDVAKVADSLRDLCGNVIKPTDPDYAEAGAELNIKMNWADTLIPFLTVYAEGSAKGRADALKELRRMASIADRYVADNTAEAFQCLERVAEDGPAGAGFRWKFIAHGARYSAKEAKALQARYAERGETVKLLPC